MRTPFFLYFFICASLCACHANSFERLCEQFPLLHYPIVSTDFSGWRMEDVTSIQENQFNSFLRTSRWHFFQSKDTRLCKYHYVPVGRLEYGEFRLLILNCGYVPEPEKYMDFDIGIFENVLLVYTKAGELVEEFVLSAQNSISESDGVFSTTWNSTMPLLVSQSKLTSDGVIELRCYKDNNHEPYRVETYLIDCITGKIHLTSNNAKYSRERNP